MSLTLMCRLAETERIQPMSNQGFVISRLGSLSIPAARDFGTLVQGAAARLAQTMEDNIVDGASGTFTYTCHDGHLHTIQVSIVDVSDEEPCEHCAGTGVKGSEEAGDGAD